MKNAWPVKAQALGGRHYKDDRDGKPYVDQNFDTYSVEYTFADGTKMMMDGRCINGCNDIYSSYAHGSKGIAIVSKNGDCGMPSSTFKGQNTQPLEHDLGIEGAPTTSGSLHERMERLDRRHPQRQAVQRSEARRRSQLVTTMGRMAAHTGQEITFDDLLNIRHEYAPDADKFTFDSPAAGRCRFERPVSDPHAGHQAGTGILISRN